MWTKLGDEWSAEARDLSDAAYRTHVDALCWSNERLLDLRIPRRDLRRFAETADPDAAVKELIAAGWWRDDGDGWFIGLRFPTGRSSRRWSRPASGTPPSASAVIAGTWSTITPSAVPSPVTRYVTGYATRYPGRVGTGRARQLRD